MRILFVISSIGIGGEQRVASILTNSFINRGINVDIATFIKNDKSYKFNNEINFIEIENVNFGKIINRIINIRNIIKTSNYDIIIGFAIIPSVLCSIAAIGFRIPVVVCERNDPKVYPILWRFVRYFVYKLAYAAIFQTKDASEYFNKKFFKLRCIIKNPIDTSNYPDSSSKNREDIIVSTSRLTPAKNHTLLIKAFSKVLERFPEFILKIYGDGFLKDSLIELRDSLGLNDKVIFVQATPNVLIEIRNYKIFILSSNNEGFPNSLAEAMALGIPSISTDCRIGGPKDMIINEINGLLVPVNDEDALINAITKLIIDKEMYERISKSSSNIKKELSVNIISDKWIDFLNIVIESSQTANKRRK